MSMDKIYFPKTDQPIVHLGQRHACLAAAANLIRDDRPESATDACDLADAMQFDGSDAEFAALEQSVDLEALLGDPHDLPCVPYDPSVYRPDKLSRLGIPTKALSSLRTLAGVTANEMQYTRGHLSRYLKYNKYRRLGAMAGSAATASTATAEPDIEVGAELVVVIRVYESFKYEARSNASMSNRLRQRITLLGSQTLADLRDRIDCPVSRYGPFNDISANPQPLLDQLASGAAVKAPERSVAGTPGIFFITDTFYTDRDRSLKRAKASKAAAAAAVFAVLEDCDYTRPIREWAQLHSGTEVDQMTGGMRSMRATRLDELSVRLGSPALYQHCGNCEHTFTVSDVRLLAAGDVRQRSRYPFVDIVSPMRPKMCMVCGMVKAAITVHQSVQHLMDPALLCTGCFVSYHYVDGCKQGEFRAYRYVGNTGVAVVDTDAEAE